jgi:hypothetical protein
VRDGVTPAAPVRLLHVDDGQAVDRLVVVREARVGAAHGVERVVDVDPARELGGGEVHVGGALRDQLVLDLADAERRAERHQGINERALGAVP